MFRKILVATDLTEHSEPALRIALELGHRLGAQVLALHVTEPPYEARRWFAPISDAELELYRSLTEREREAALQALDAQVARLAGETGAPKPDLLVRSGIPTDVIPTLAGELGCDAIVMGTHGRRGVQHLLLGSIAERVIRTASCPVLTVRPPA